jgi:NAD(P)-dependent dehydrogenase (short-subunit alcohol dehydrogenase family)
MSALKNRVAFVTGSSRGIGAASAKGFAREGANVVVHGRDIGALTSVRHDIEAAGDRVSQVVADVTEFNEIEFARCQIENASALWTSWSRTPAAALCRLRPSRTYLRRDGAHRLTAILRRRP